MKVLPSSLSCPTLSPRAHPQPGPPPGLSTEQPDRSPLVPRHRDTQDPARGCRSAPLTRDRRPEPAPHPNPSHTPHPTLQAGALRDSGEDSHPTGRCLPVPRQRRGWEKLDQLAPPEGESSGGPSASVPDPATHSPGRSQLFPGALVQLAGSWGERAAAGSRAAQEAGLTPPLARTSPSSTC